MSGGAATGSEPLRELDLLRGLAIVMMVVNHAGVRLVERASVDSGALGAWIFWGSFAPVVFFFTTGVGVSLARRSGSAWDDILSAAGKAALLLVADQLGFWATGRAWGLDFLGFIAISSVCVTALARTPRPLLIGSVLIVLLVLSRYVLGALWFPSFDDPGLGAWLVGTTAVRNVSYPAAPWLVYPLLGFMLALGYVKAAQTPAGVMRWAWRGLAVCAVFLALAFAMYLRGVVFYRWGVMSSGFFVMSLGVVLGMAAIAMLLKVLQPWTVGVLGLRGAASLAVVPIHMALIEVSAGVVPRALAAWEFVVFAVVLVALSMWLSVRFADAVVQRSGPAARGVAMALLVACVAACAALWWQGRVGVAMATTLVTVGQLSVAALLAFRNKQRAAGQPGRSTAVTRPTAGVP